MEGDIMTNPIEERLDKMMWEAITNNMDTAPAEPKIDGRRKPTFSEQGYVKCECTIKDQDERIKRCSEAGVPVYGSGGCLYYLEGGFCWLSIPK
jgi:hypothetical protein